MKILLIIVVMLFANAVLAKGITVDWSCPADSPKVPINIYNDDSGNIVFVPNLPFVSMGIDPSVCIRNFNENIAIELKKFKDEKCPAAQDPFCYSSLGFSKEKISKHLSSFDVLKNPSFVAASLGYSDMTPERTLIRKISAGEIDPAKLNQTFGHGGKEHKVSDFDKVVGDNIENVFSKMNREEAKQYAQNYMLAKASVLNSRSPTVARAQVHANLEKMFGYIHGEKGESELASALQCLPQDQNMNDLRAVVSRIQRVSEDSRCEQLNPGQAKVFKKDSADFYGTGDYTLKRKPDGNYQVIVNIDFATGSGSLSPAAMLDRTKKCMAEASPFMKGPNNEVMEMTVVSPAEADRLPRNEKPDANKVTVESPTFGTNSGAYAETVDCPVITHEVLHLLGLCDEYKEDRPEYANQRWHCRVITKAPSIMRDTGAYRKALGGTLSCDCTSPYCTNIMKSGNEALKNLYASQNFYDASDFHWRSSRCTETYMNAQNISDPSKPILILEEETDKIVVESRYLSRFDGAPFYKIGRSKITCICPPGDSVCRQQLKSAATLARNPQTRKSCPSGAPYKGSEVGQKVSSFALNGETLQIFNKPEIPSLLQPNHFYKILEGGCKGRSAGYQECAAHAYKRPDPTCGAPERCQDDNFYLGSPQ